MSSLCTPTYLKDVWYEDPEEKDENDETGAVENCFSQLIDEQQLYVIPLTQPGGRKDLCLLRKSNNEKTTKLAKFPGFVTCFPSTYDDHILTALPPQFKRGKLDKSFSWYGFIRFQERYITTFILENELRVLIGEMYGTLKSRKYVSLSIEMWERLTSDYVFYMVREAIAQLDGVRHWLPGDKGSEIEWYPCTDGVHRMYLGENKWLVVIKEGSIHVCIRKFFYSTLVDDNCAGHGINLSFSDWFNLHLLGSKLNKKLEEKNMITR